MNYEIVECSPHDEGNFYNDPPVFVIKEPKIVLYTYIVRNKDTDVDYSLCLKSPNDDNSNTTYAYLRMSKELYDKQSRYIDNDIKNGELFRLKKGEWSYYVQGLTEDGNRITSKVKDIMLELDNLANSTNYPQTFAGIKCSAKRDIATKYRSIIERIQLHTKDDTSGYYI